MQKLLLCGGLGFVGKNLIEVLKDKYRVVVLDKKRDSDFLEKHQVTYYNLDFSDEKELKEILLAENPDFVINLISIVTAERTLELFDDLLEVNFRIFMKLYNVCNKIKKLKLFINLGSAEEYGNIDAPYSETDRESPSSPYALVKQFTTNTAIMFYKNYGFPVCVVRPGNLFGKYQPSNKFIPYVLNTLSLNREIEMTEGEQRRDFIYVKRFIDLLEQIIHNFNTLKGEIINVASGHGVSLKEVVEYLRVKLNSKSNIVWGSIPYRENEMMDFRCNISKLDRIINCGLRNNLWNDLDSYIVEERG